MPNDPRPLLQRCETALQAMRDRTTKYQVAVSKLAEDEAVTKDKLKKKEFKLEKAFDELGAAQKAMKGFLDGPFKQDFEAARQADDKKKIKKMEDWKEGVKYLLFRMTQAAAARSYVPTADAFFDDE